MTDKAQETPSTTNTTELNESYSSLQKELAFYLYASSLSQTFTSKCSATDKTTAIDKIQVSGDYIFECSETLAKIYFPQFLSEAEIIEPRELRLWFKEQFEEASRVYKR